MALKILVNQLVVQTKFAVSPAFFRFLLFFLTLFTQFLLLNILFMLQTTRVVIEQDFLKYKDDINGTIGANTVSPIWSYPWAMADTCPIFNGHPIGYKAKFIRKTCSTRTTTLEDIHYPRIFKFYHPFTVGVTLINISTSLGCIQKLQNCMIQPSCIQTLESRCK